MFLLTIGTGGPLLVIRFVYQLYENFSVNKKQISIITTHVVVKTRLGGSGKT